MSELRAWFGDPDLKSSVAAKMRKHRALDEIIRGSYQEPKSINDQVTGFKGCALGCILPQMYTYVDDPAWDGFPRDRWLRSEDAETYQESGWSGLVEKYYGIDRRVAGCIDNTFEEQTSFETAARFAVAVIEAIPVGADLSLIDVMFETLWDEKVDELRDRDDDWSDTMATWSAKTLIGLLFKAPVREVKV